MYNPRANGRGYAPPVDAEPGLSLLGATEGEHVLSLRDVFQVLRRRLWVIGLVTIVLVAAVVGFSLAQTPTYEASIEILVGQERVNEGNPPQGATELEQLTRTIARAVNSPPVAEAVIQQLDLGIAPEDFLRRLKVEQIPNTQFVKVDYEDPSPDRAQQVANTIGDVFSEQISTVSPSASAITASVWVRAVTPDEPVSPKPVRNGFLAMMLGIAFGMGLALLLEYLDDSWRSPEEAEQISGVPAFGVIPKSKLLTHIVRREDTRLDRFLRRATLRRARKEGGSEEGLAERLVTMLEPTSAASEAYRSLRTNLIYALVDTPPKVIVLTSPGPGEGKSTTCANLGVVLAQAGKRTLIFDCDLRKPVVHKFFGIHNLHGIVDLLAGQASLEEVWQEPIEGLKVVSVGPIPPNPAELLDTQRFAQLLLAVQEEFDYVLIDASPVGLVSDPAILAAKGDGVLLVLDAQGTRKGAVRQAIRSLQAVGAKVLGMVMNNVEGSKGGYYYYGHTYKSPR